MPVFRIILLLLIISCPRILFSQNKWHLDDCIHFALENNLDLRRQKFVRDVKSVIYKESKWAFSPNVSIGSSYTESFGRVLDQTTYEFIRNSDIRSNSTSITGSMTLFSGFKRLNNIKRARLDLMTAEEDISSMQLEIKKRVISAFFTLLCCRANYESANSTKELYDAQINKIRIMVEAGKVTESDLLRVKSQALSAANDVVSAKGDVELALLALCQILDIKDTSIVDIEWEEQLIPPGHIEEQNVIVMSRPEFKAAVLRTQIARKDLSIIKASFYPTLTLTAGYGSSYSSSRKKIEQTYDGRTIYGSYPFIDQYKDNANSYFGFSLTIPIFYGRASANAVKKAQIAIKDAEYAEYVVENELIKEYAQINIECQTAYSQYVSAQEQLRFAEEAERQVRERYFIGVTDYNSWNTAINELSTAKYSLSVAKYTYMFKRKVLELIINM